MRLNDWKRDTTLRRLRQNSSFRVGWEWRKTKADFESRPFLSSKLTARPFPELLYPEPARD